MPAKILTTEEIRRQQKVDADKRYDAIKANLPAVAPTPKSTAVILKDELDEINRTLDEISPTTMAGLMVKFTKDGAFEVTSTGVRLDNMTDFRARCAETHYGYVRFNGEGQPPDRAMGPLYGGYKVRREDLGDSDENAWEIDRFTGKPRDPWIFQFWLVLENVATHELYTFVTGSVTGTRAVKRLLEHFNRLQETKPGADPIVKLVRSSYKHRKFGEVPIPMFQVTGRDIGGPPPPPLAKELNDAINF